MDDIPTTVPLRQISGEPVKSVHDAIRERRATPSFLPDPVPDEYLDAILRLGAQAPSGYNLQPWRFIVVQDEENRRRLQRCSYDQPKVGEAPVVVIALGMKEDVVRRAPDVLREGAQRGLGNPTTVEATIQSVVSGLDKAPMPLWVNRHTMLAVTTMMLAAEGFGFDTAPMEGFDAEALKREFGVPDEAEVVALLAIGKRKGADKPYGGRLPLSETVYRERFGAAWSE